MGRARAGKAKRSSKHTLTAMVASALRGDNAFHNTIITLHRAILSRPGERISGVNAFVLRNSLRVHPDSFAESLKIDSSHIEQIQQLGKIKDNSTASINYLHICAEYILLNKDRVDTWIDFDAKASELLISATPDDVRAHLLQQSPIDQQALASLKVFAGLHSYSDSIIKEYFSQNMSSAWTKSRLLYALIYYYINLPDGSVLDQVLVHLLPQGKFQDVERKLIHFLLEPHRPGVANLATRCYVGLLSHPYDALEYVTSFVEFELAAGDQIGGDLAQLVGRLASAFPNHRISKLHSLASGNPLPFSSRLEQLSGMRSLQGSYEEAAILEMLDVSRRSSEIAPTKNPVMEALHSLRWNRYPDPNDYHALSVYRQRFRILSAGTLIDTVATGLFLFGREGPAMERLTLLRGAVIGGAITPFLLGAPGGHQIVRSSFARSNTSSEEMITQLIDLYGPHAEERQDRIWINAANWSLSTLQWQGRLNEWMIQARKKFPIWVEPRYLSGLDWKWLADVIDQVGVIPFRGNSDGIYVLFMRQLEEFLRESLPLRLAVEPIARGSSDVLAFRDWMRSELGRDMAAFIDLFLTADTILKLRLADNYTAAMSMRLQLLEWCAIQFNFIPGVLTEETLTREEAALTAMLSRMSLGARQFEIPWNTLATDAAYRNRAAYEAYNTMADAVGETLSINNARRKSTFPYSNGAIGEYEGRNRDWPLILVIAGIVDTFLSHPTSGIEAILSVRIRHDSFRREFSSAIQQVQQSSIPGISGATNQRLVKYFEGGLYREIQSWLDSRMHTLRKAKPNAIFDFTPTHDDMAALLAKAVAAKDLEEIVQIVLEWARPRLLKQLHQARLSIERDLRPALEGRVDRICSELISAGEPEFAVSRIGPALKGVLVRRSSEIQEWFKVPERGRDRSLTVMEVELAAQQRFRLDMEAGKLIYEKMPDVLRDRVLAPERIRHLYDLISEITQNSLKHSKRPRTRIRTTIVNDNISQYVAYSNLAAKSERSINTVKGHPYTTLQDTLFGEGKSGIKKIAYLSASLAQEPVEVIIARRRHSFHVLVPLCAFGDPNG